MTKSKNILEDFKDIIEIDSHIKNGKPVFKGTRIEVSYILEHLIKGWSIPDIKSQYPSIKKNDIKKILSRFSQNFQ